MGNDNKCTNFALLLPILLQPKMKKIAFIVSSLIGQKKKILTDINTHFSNLPGYSYQIMETQRAKHAPELARQAFLEGYACIIAVGGDGTLNEVVNGVLQGAGVFNHLPDLVNQPLRTDNLPNAVFEQLKKCVIGVYPAGSGNDFSRTAQVLRSAQHLKQLIENNKQVLVDVGIGLFTPLAAAETACRAFINATDVGMGGSATFFLAQMKSKSWLSPTLQYAKAIVQTFLTYQKQEVAFTGENFSWQGKMMSLVMANGKYFGSGLGIAPYADLSDGQLSAVVLGNVSLWHYISYLPKLRRCEVINNPQVRYFNDECISVQSLGQPLYMQMDGELVGTTPVQVGIMKQCLPMLVAV